MNLTKYNNQEITMRFSKKQQKVIKMIASGDIQDIYTFLTSFNLVSLEQYDKDEIKQKFENDTIPKKYFYPKNVKPKFITIETQESFEQKVNKGSIRPDSYNNFPLSLNFNNGIKHLTWNDNDYEINFYDGVYTAKSFEDIVSFLSIWQYLKSEMLVLELPSKLTAQTLGLFFEKQTTCNPYESLNQEERIKKINFDNQTIDDRNYFNGVDYKFSNDHCTICKEYLGRKIYPTPELNTFIHRKFKTTEEKNQGSALLAAWLAIFVAILLSLLPRFQKSDSEYYTESIKKLDSIRSELHTIKNQSVTDNQEIKINLEKIEQQLQKCNNSSKLSNIERKLDKIIEKLNSLK